MYSISVKSTPHTRSAWREASKVFDEDRRLRTLARSPEGSMRDDRNRCLRGSALSFRRCGSSALGNGARAGWPGSCGRSFSSIDSGPIPATSNVLSRTAVRRLVVVSRPVGRNSAAASARIMSSSLCHWLRSGPSNESDLLVQTRNKTTIEPTMG